MNKLLFFKKLTPSKIIFGLSAALSILCFLYLIKGFYELTINASASDLYARWKEQRYIYYGLYPYDITNGSPLIDSQLGAVTSGGYPAWAFFSGFIFFPPIPFELTRWYHALLNAISLVILAIFAYQIGKPYGKLKAWFTVVACLSIGTHTTTLGNGQYGIIVNALLIVMFWLLQSNANISAGLILGLALLKPNISALYFLIPIIKKRINAVIACCLYIAVSSSIIGIIVKVSPIYMIEKVVNVSQYYVDSGYSGINVLLKFGINPLLATILLAIIATVVTFGLFYLFQDCSLLFLFAIASGIGRLWTYHLIYDNVMLVFLLLAIIELNFKKPNRFNILILILLCLTLLLPSRISDSSYAQIFQTIIWCTSLSYIVICQKEFKVI